MLTTQSENLHNSWTERYVCWCKLFLILQHLEHFVLSWSVFICPACFSSETYLIELLRFFHACLKNPSISHGCGLLTYYAFCSFCCRSVAVGASSVTHIHSISNNFNNCQAPSFSKMSNFYRNGSFCVIKSHFCPVCSQHSSDLFIFFLDEQKRPPPCSLKVKVTAWNYDACAICLRWNNPCAITLRWHFWSLNMVSVFHDPFFSRSKEFPPGSNSPKVFTKALELFMSASSLIIYTTSLYFREPFTFIVYGFISRFWYRFKELAYSLVIWIDTLIFLKLSLQKFIIPWTDQLLNCFQCCSAVKCHFDQLILIRTWQKCLVLGRFQTLLWHEIFANKLFFS